MVGIVKWTVRDEARMHQLERKLFYMKMADARRRAIRRNNRTANRRSIFHVPAFSRMMGR
jgi:hypothetical protein